MSFSIKIPIRKQLSILDYLDKSKVIKENFLKSELGKIYIGIPWENMIKELGLEKSKKGPDSIFSAHGKLALMFLKSFLNCSDRQLMDALNGNIYFKIFCDLDISRIDPVANYKIISKIRVEISKLLDIENSEKVLVDYWHPYMKDLGHITMDATCYETSMRYPTDQKLLWECIEYLHKHVKALEEELKIKLPRNQYEKWSKENKRYIRKKLPRKKLRIRITRGFLNLLSRLELDLSKLENVYEEKNPNKELGDKHKEIRRTIEKIYAQQLAYFNENAKPKDRIVSIFKPYIRPIVRGKERKKVEFGAKVNKVMIDRISFIEKISFDNFNEGCNYVSSILKAEKLTGERVTITGGDAIYAKNKNRSYAKSKDIRTDFRRKGKAGQYERERKILSNQISKERGSSLEGSFGKDKAYYGLKEIKARNKETEILWIFFGIHTGNALEIGRRMYRRYESLQKELLKTAS